jgi:hypothetical protein
VGHRLKFCFPTKKEEGYHSHNHGDDSHSQSEVHHHEGKIILNTSTVLRTEQKRTVLGER